MSEHEFSYSRILRSSSIIGAAQVLTYIVGLVRLKIVAVILGPSGFGVISLYTSALQLVGVVSSLGIGSSAVRDVVGAYQGGDAKRAARTVIVLRRVCWVTGLSGWVLAAAFSEPISSYMIGSREHAATIALLGVTILINALTGGQLAVLQGLRRIGDLARANVYGVVCSSVLAIGLYCGLGHAGIIPVLIVTPLVSLGWAYWFANQVPVEPVKVQWTETWRHAKGMIVLGGAFMSSALLTVGIEMLTRSLIAHRFGLEAVGMYQAAWAISGMFAGFVLGAMGTDFYPRLTATIHDKPAAVRAVNEQIEVGILLALPGLLATIVFAPSIMQLVYSSEFMAGAELLPWLVLGVFGRVLSWPMGFIQLAGGYTRSFFITEVYFGAGYASLTAASIWSFGVIGAAYAFAGVYFLYTAMMIGVSHHLIGFLPSRKLLNLSALAFASISAELVIPSLLPKGVHHAADAMIVAAGSMLSIRGLADRLGPSHPFVRCLRLVPGARVLFMIKSDRPSG